MEIKSAQYLTSSTSGKNIKDYGKPEIAFVGRSNCGKSSLINAVTNRNKLARSSSTPGRTKMSNYFIVNQNDKSNPEFLLVDLPGYGFAKASKTDIVAYHDLIESYLLHSSQLKLVFVLMDIRHLPSELDKEMLRFLYSNNKSFKVILTKSDKLSRSQINNQITAIANDLGLGKDDVFAVSAEKKTGIDKVRDIIEDFLNI